MTTSSPIAQQIERQSVVPIESSIPLEMTCDGWRQWRSGRPHRLRRQGAARVFAVALRLLRLGAAPCKHFHESTTRYDHDQKQLSFLLVCPVCGTEKLVHRQPYEPRFEPHPARESAWATVHDLPVRRQPPPGRRAA
jgi:hypothetical protein